MTEMNESPDSATQLLHLHRTAIRAYLLAAVRDRHDAEDLFQEVSIAVLRSTHEYESGTSFRAWAREIARRRVLEHARRSRRNPALLESGALERAASDLEDADDRRDALRECLEKMGPIGRKVIDLRYGDAHDVSKIATSIGKSIQATYALLKRARQTLRDCAERRLAGGAVAIEEP